MLLYIIRHAQSENNALWARNHSSEGRLPDPPITSIGHRQARMTAEYLAYSVPEIELAEQPDRHNRQDFGLTHLYTSLMVRAVTTADYISQATGLKMHAWPEVHERGGLYMRDPESDERVGIEGPNREFFVSNYPRLQLPDNLGESGWWDQRPPEAVEEAIPRAIGVWQKLLEAHGDTDDHVAMVSHGGFFQSLMMTMRTAHEATSFPEQAATPFHFGISNTSISRFEFNGDFVSARYLNRVDHLPADLLTG